MNKKYISLIAGTGLLMSLALALPAFAQTQVSANVGASVGGGMGMMHGGFRGGPGPARVPGVFGTVTAINGTSLTVTSKTFGFQHSSSSAATTAAATVYTVDASNATVYKDNATSTISVVATGDTLMVQGTISGTNVVARTIRDGVVPGGAMGEQGMGGGLGRGASSTRMNASSTPIITGNGEPVIAGSISAISGDTLTVTNASNVTYSVDATNAKIVKNGTSTALANITTGDNVVIQGVVNGTSVTASSVIDQGTGSHSGTPTTTPSKGGGAGGFLGAIGGFFKHLFGF
jgi:hypothetical protein